MFKHWRKNEKRDVGNEKRDVSNEKRDVSHEKRDVGNEKRDVGHEKRDVSNQKRRPNPQPLPRIGKGSKTQSLSPCRREVWREVRLYLYKSFNLFTKFRTKAVC